MADKINMSLDDIIKGQKKINSVKQKQQKAGPSNVNNKNKNAGKPRAGKAKPGNAKAGRRAPPVKNLRVALANKVLKRSKAIAARRAANVAGAKGRVAAGPTSVLSAVATKKLVNKLVKNALRKRTNITAPQVIRKRGGVAVSTLAARRNLALKRNATARVIAQPVRTIVQHVQPAAPVRVVREIITAPPAETRVIRRGPPPQQARRNRQQQQQQRRTVVVQQVQQGRRFRQASNNMNRQRNERPTVIRRQVVQQAPRRVPVQQMPQYERVVQRVVQAPIPQQRFQQQQQQPQRFQRQQNVRYVNAAPRQQQRRTVVQKVQQVRYQPVQYVSEQAVSSRGRGFRSF